MASERDPRLVVAAIQRLLAAGGDVEKVKVANANNLIKLAHGLAVTAGRADGITCRNNMTGVQANPRFPTLGSVVN